MNTTSRKRSRTLLTLYREMWQDAELLEEVMPEAAEPVARYTLGALADHRVPFEDVVPLLLLSGVVATAACSDLDVPDYYAGSIDELTGSPTPTLVITHAIYGEHSQSLESSRMVRVRLDPPPVTGRVVDAVGERPVRVGVVGGDHDVVVAQFVHHHGE